MKKIIFIVIVIIISFILYVNVNASVDEVIIPDAAIRVRVIANSNSIYDQSMKMKVKNYIEKTISSKLINVSDIDMAREVINSEISNLNQGINDIFNQNNYNMEYVIHFGDNFFPEKVYKGVHYKEGSYESLVVTIGEGAGDNWWCVLFPPLCLLEGEDNNTEDVEYQFFVKKMLDKVFS